MGNRQEATGDACCPTPDTCHQRFNAVKIYYIL